MEEEEEGYTYRARKPARDSMDPDVDEEYTSRHRTQEPISKPMQEEEEEGGGGGYTYKTHRPSHDTNMDQEDDEDYTYKKKNYTNQSTHRRQEEEEEEDYSDRNTRKPDYSTEKPTHAKEASSTSDMLSSAKYLAEATQHAFRHETDMIDRSGVAGAAEDLLQAASRYGKLDEKGFGGYIDKAESYLHQYHSSSSPAPGGGDQSSQPSHDGGGGGGGGYGDYLKMAEGFLKKS